MQVHQNCTVNSRGVGGRHNHTRTGYPPYMAFVGLNRRVGPESLNLLCRSRSSFRRLEGLLGIILVPIRRLRESCRSPRGGYHGADERGQVLRVIAVNVPDVKSAVGAVPPLRGGYSACGRPLPGHGHSGLRRTLGSGRAAPDRHSGLRPTFRGIEFL